MTLLPYKGTIAPKLKPPPWVHGSPWVIHTIDTHVINTDPKHWKNPRQFIGVRRDGQFEIFESKVEPTFSTHSQYRGYIGPFKSKTACKWALIYGPTSKKFNTVGDAERLSRSGKIVHIPGLNHTTAKIQVIEL